MLGCDRYFVFRVSPLRFPCPDGRPYSATKMLERFVSYVMFVVTSQLSIRTFTILRYNVFVYRPTCKKDRPTPRGDYLSNRHTLMRCGSVAHIPRLRDARRAKSSLRVSLPPPSVFQHWYIGCAKPVTRPSSCPDAAP